MPWESSVGYEVEKKGHLYLIKKTPNTGMCVYFAWKEHNTWGCGCTIYDRRPVECRLYPLMLHLEAGTPTIILDPRATCGPGFPATAGMLATAFEVLHRIHRANPEWLIEYNRSGG